MLTGESVESARFVHKWGWRYLLGILVGGTLAYNSAPLRTKTAAKMAIFGRITPLLIQNLANKKERSRWVIAEISV